MNKKNNLYNKYKGECQYCGFPLDDFEWVIHHGKYEDYPVHIFCEEQIYYEETVNKVL